MAYFIKFLLSLCEFHIMHPKHLPLYLPSTLATFPITGKKNSSVEFVLYHTVAIV